MWRIIQVVLYILSLLLNWRPKTSLSNTGEKTENATMSWSPEMPLSAEIWSHIQKASQTHDLPSDLVASVVMVESAGNPWAMRFEPDWRYVWQSAVFAKMIQSSVLTEQTMQSTSWGLMQVMGTVARELGHKGWLSELCQPEVGLDYGARHLKDKIKKYGELDGIAAYNSGMPRRLENGALANQVYLDKILRYRERFSILLHSNEKRG